MLDTVNFCPSAKRATALDADVAERLQRLVPHVSRRDLYAQLQSAKEDVRGLSLEQLLRKDLKDVPAPHHPSHGQVSNSDTLASKFDWEHLPQKTS